LIEKAYISFQDLIEKWQETANDLHHLISERLLVPCIVWNDLLAVYEWRLDESNKLTLHPVKKTKNAGFYGLDVERLDTWLYMTEPIRTGATNYHFYWAVSEIESINPKEGDIWYKLSYFDNGKLLNNEIGPIFIESQAVFMKKVIDDLEKSMPALSIGNCSPSNNNDPKYDTEWLKIQQDAIKKFFNPRRNPDAKRAEVIEWIKDEAKNRNLEVSENLAAAIFTIIKAENHSPRKKRA
jgi:hypothetical protein